MSRNNAYFPVTPAWTKALIYYTAIGTGQTLNIINALRDLYIQPALTDSHPSACTLAEQGTQENASIEEGSWLYRFTYNKYRLNKKHPYVKVFMLNTDTSQMLH